MPNERFDVPSASSMERVSLCPGSHRFESSLPNQQSEDTKAGDEAHDVAARYFRSFEAGDAWPEFKIEEQSCELRIADVVSDFIAMARAVYTDWQQYVLPGNPMVKIVEERIVWMEKREGKFAPVTSGKLDLAWVCGTDSLILDMKSLYGEQPASTRNLQLRTYAVLVNEEYGCTRIFVAICQPRVSKQAQLCDYGAGSIAASRSELRLILAAAAAEDAPLYAGRVQCKHCRARGVCSAAAKYASLATVAPNRPLARGEGTKIAAALSVEQRVALWSNISTINKILDAVRDNLLLLPEDMLAEHGLEVVVARGDRTIKDAPTAYEALKDYLDPKDFNTCCNVGITKLQDAFRKKTTLPHKDAVAKLEGLLGDNLGRKADSKQLVRRRGGPIARTAELNLEITTNPKGELEGHVET